MKWPDPQAVGWVVVFWVVCGGIWWLSNNAMSVLTGIIAVIAILALSVMIYGAVRAIQRSFP